MRGTSWLFMVATLLLPAAALAQIPLPSGNPFDERKPAAATAKKADPTAQAQARVDALKAQLAAIRELSSWASTNRSELYKLYSDSLANLIQARSAIQKAKNQAAGSYVEPKGFEIEPVVVTTADTYPGAASSYTVPVVPPDNFYLHTRVQFPEQWVSAKKRLTVSYQVYSDDYLPMATTYQNTTNAIFRAYSYALTVQARTDTFRSPVKGLCLVPGHRYFVSVVVSTYDYPRDSLVSLGVFRVDGKIQPTVTTNLPHYADWYATYNSVLELPDVKAAAKAKAMTISGSFKRKDFVKGVKPVYVEAIAEAASGDKRVLVRKAQPLTAATGKFSFAIKEHGLAAGTYTIRVVVYTEHPSDATKYAYLKGSKTEKTVTGVTVQ